MLAMLMLSATPVTESSWDDALALSLTRELVARPLPGLVQAERWPAARCGGTERWFVTLDAGFRGTTIQCAVSAESSSCARTPDGTVYFPCDRRVLPPDAALDGLAKTVATWTRRAEVPPDTSLVVRKAPHGFELQVADAKRSSRRAAFQLESGWRLSPALEALGGFDASIEPLWLGGEGDDARWLLVWADIDGGMGNNASGYENYTGVVVRDDGERLRFVDAVSLGSASWARSVTDEGFRMGFDAKLLCPQWWAGGLELVPACVVSPDPRNFAGDYAHRCATTCPKRAPPRFEGQGRYLLRGDRLVRARGGALRAHLVPGDLVIVERPESLAYLEVENRSKDVLQLDELEVSGDGSGSGFNLVGPCLVDAGERVLLELSSVEAPPAALACRVEGVGLEADRLVTLRDRSPDGVLRGRVLTRSTVTWRERAEDDTTERAWQLDASGRACVRAPTPGQPNPPCR